MRFRPLRSRAFWFGLPGLVFLLWGWWMSTEHYSGVGFGGHSLGIAQLGGEVFVFWRSDGWPDWRSLGAFHNDMPWEDARELKRLQALSQPMVPTFRRIFIPYHWPVLFYLAAWAGLMFWRGRKFRQGTPAGN
jgi:hypothetical protein